VIQSAKPSACKTVDATRAPRREKRSASAPEGISATKPTADQMMSRAEIWLSESPLSAKKRA
jgi:hypothetical protein